MRFTSRSTLEPARAPGIASRLRRGKDTRPESHSSEHRSGGEQAIPCGTGTRRRGGLIAVAGLAGLGKGLTASPLPSPAAQLRTTGVFACVRHPVYSALLLGGAAFVALGGRLSRVWVWAALLALLLIKVGVEEAALTARFPGYRSYAESTPRLLPDPGEPPGMVATTDAAHHRTGG